LGGEASAYAGAAVLLPGIILAELIFEWSGPAENTALLLLVAAVPLASLCFILLLREIDVRMFDAPDWLITVTSGRGRKTIQPRGSSPKSPNRNKPMSPEPLAMSALGQKRT
jgi:hypothetical protein